MRFARHASGLPDPAQCDPHHDHLAVGGHALEDSHPGSRGRRELKTVHWAWQAHGLKPRRPRTFKLSRDPQFVEKLMEVGQALPELARQRPLLC